MRQISLKAARVDNGLTQEQLAEKLGIATQTLKLYERGERHITYDLALKTAEILNFELGDIKFF